jgi:hypothetical protein
MRCSLSTSARKRRASPKVLTFGIDFKKASNWRVEEEAVMEVVGGRFRERKGEFCRVPDDGSGKLDRADRNLLTCFLLVNDVSGR